jgi:hypothetical protein
MSASTLRAAAALIRQRASHPDLPPQRWEMYEEHGRDFTDEGWSEVGIKALGVTLAYTCSTGFEDNDDPQAVAAHIASWHPDVALAVADLIDTVLKVGPVDGGAEWDATVTLARTYLGGESA